jgi:hypothetical protein
VAREDDAEEVEDLALEPVGGGVHAGDGVNHLVLGHPHLETHAPVRPHRQEVVHDVKAERAARVVHRRHVHERREAAVGVGLEKGHDLDDGRRAHLEHQRAMRRLVRQDRPVRARGDGRAERQERLGRRHGAWTGTTGSGAPEGGALPEVASAMERLP